MRSTFFLILALIAGLFVSCLKGGDDALIPVKSSDKWGYINHKGEYVINPQFNDANFFKEGIAKVESSNGKIGYINTEGKYEIAATYKQGTSYSEGLAFVVSEGSYPTCIDKQGNIKFVIKEAEYVTSFKEGLALFVNKDEKFGFVDKTGKVVINAQFDYASPFHGDFAIVMQKGKAGFIGKDGKIVINPQFKSVQYFQDNKAVFSDGKKMGYIDPKGAYIINPQFERAKSFSEGLAAVRQGDLWGYINTEGKFEINPQFDEALAFKNGLAVVKQGDLYGYINKEGKYEINPQFEEAMHFYSDIAPVQSSDKWGFVDKKGKYVINPQFDNIKINEEIYIREIEYIREYLNFLFEYAMDFVMSDYYDASKFINKFFTRDTNNSFDGFTSSTTLNKVVNHKHYGDDLNANNKYRADCIQYLDITDDISIYKTSFYFATPIYKMVKSYDDYWGYYEGESKVYDFTAKLTVIEYQFNLRGKAEDKGSAIANALKTEIEKRHQLKMESKNEIYSSYQEAGKLSFAIVYDDNSIILFIGFGKEKLQDILSEYYEKDVEEEYYGKETEEVAEEAAPYDEY